MSSISTFTFDVYAPKNSTHKLRADELESMMDYIDKEYHTEIYSCFNSGFCFELKTNYAGDDIEDMLDHFMKLYPDYLFVIECDFGDEFFKVYGANGKFEWVESAIIYPKPHMDTSRWGDL